jgi:phenylalanine-4-hydroxylase
MQSPSVEIFRKFTHEEDQTWGELFVRQAHQRSVQMHPVFEEGLRILEMDSTRVPDLERVNQILINRTGFRGVPVTGHEDPRSFFPMLARGEFPIGNFIRDRNDINYTPAPDVFHDLYGHLPFYANIEYANFSRELGRRGAKYIENAALLRQWERLFWFALEFSLIETPKGRRIFGAGLASSYGESAYALSDQPEVLPFNLEIIRMQEFRIDEFQKKIFMLNDTDQLYRCLNAFEEGCKHENK